MSADGTTKDRSNHACNDEDCRHDGHVLCVISTRDQIRGDNHDQRVYARSPHALQGAEYDAVCVDSANRNLK